MRCAECSSKRATRLHRRCVDTLQSDAQPRLVRFADGPGPIYVLARTGTLTGHFKSIVHHAGTTNAARRLPSREGAPPPPAKSGGGSFIEGKQDSLEGDKYQNFHWIS